MMRKRKKESKEFKNLKILIEIFSKYRIDNLETLANPGKGKTKVDQLYNDILEGKIDGIDDVAANYKTHRSLMAILKKKLINSILFIDENKAEFATFAKAYYKCYQKFSVVKMLLGRGAISPGISICKSTLAITERYEFTNLSLELSRILKSHFATREENTSKFEYYKNKARHYLDAMNAEYELEDIYETLTESYLKSSLVNEKALVYQNDKEYLKGLVDQHNTNKLHDIYYRILIHIYLSEKDFNKLIKTCQEAISLLKKRATTNPTSIFWFEVNMLNIFIVTKKYDEGSKIIEKSLENVEEGTTNWLTVLNFYFKLALHSGKYKEAYFLLRRGQEQIRLKRKQLKRGHIEQWEINDLCIQYFIEIGKIESKKEDDQWLIKINQFLAKKISSFDDKNKRIENINTLILQIIFLLNRKKEGDVLDKLELLKRFDVKKLYRNEDHRINCFIKILLSIPEGHFNHISVARKAAVNLKELKSSPIETTANSSQMELIPYEDLWEIVLVQLEEKFC